jgi:anti-sigma B factor antagonist
MVLATHLSLTEERAQEELILHARGEVDASTAPQFAGALSRAADGDRARLTVDLSRVEFIDVKGYAALLNAHRKVQDAHGEMAVLCPEGPVRQLLSLLDTAHVLRFIS